ncbi:MAG: FAD-dependent oxidoreductase [Thermomicrobia bacterium]|nr:FAD-dependent oxidoreductase [Thermomicrobia bacterium]
MTMQTELAIVGGGPAGLAAAIEAARRDLRVTLVDSGDRPGGALSLQMHSYDGLGLSGPAIGDLLWHAAAAAGATLLPQTLAWGLFEDHTVGLAVNHGTDAERSDLLDADVVLIATGAVDRFSPFPGATLPGVLTATAALTMLHRWRVRPGTTALIVGSDPITPRIEQAVREAGMAVTRAPATEGLRALAGPDTTLATVEQRDAAALEWALEANTMILAEGMQPANELSRMVDCDMAWSAALGGHVPLRDHGMRTSVPGISVAGDAAGVGDVGSALLQGRLAAAAIADRLGKKKRAFGTFPVTVASGAFRPIHADVWQSVRMAVVRR